MRVHAKHTPLMGVWGHAQKIQFEIYCSEIGLGDISNPNHKFEENMCLKCT